MEYIVDNSESINGFDYTNKLLVNKGESSIYIISNISISRAGKPIENNYTCIELSEREVVKLRDTLIKVCPIDGEDNG